jgi:excisionase family DNA binding protein
MTARPIEARMKARDALILSLGEPLPALVPINDICRVLHVSRDTVYWMMKTGALPYCHIGARRRILITSLEDFLADRV